MCSAGQYPGDVSCWHQQSQRCMFVIMTECLCLLSIFTSTERLEPGPLLVPATPPHCLAWSETQYYQQTEHHYIPPPAPELCKVVSRRIEFLVKHRQHFLFTQPTTTRTVEWQRPRIWRFRIVLMIWARRRWWWCKSILLTYDHVSIVTLVRDERVVGDGVEHDPAKLGMLRDWAGDGCNIFHSL